jgi:predicted Rossmann-fold nucleotide-binding protein
VTRKFGAFVHSFAAVVCSAIAVSGGIGTLEELRSVLAALYCSHLLLRPSLTRRSEFLSMRYLADAIERTTAAGTYRIKPVALLNTRKCGKPEASSGRCALAHIAS